MAEVTTSGKVIQKPEIVLGTDDFLPPGLVGVRVRKPEDDDLTDSSAGSDSTGSVVDPSDLDNGEENNVPDPINDYGQLPIPTTLRIISQTIRVGPDGKMLVDVVIETDDFPGIKEFEARVVRDL